MKKCTLLWLSITTALLGTNVVVALSTSFDVEGVPLYNYRPPKPGDVHVANDDKPTWILITKPQVSDTQVHSVCEDASACVSEGHPSGGGIGFLSVKATKKELGQIVHKHKRELDFIEVSNTGFLFPSEASNSTLVAPVDTDRWNLDRIDARTKDANGKTTDGKYAPAGTGKGVHVYIVDSGIRRTHEEFGGRAVPAIDVSSGSVVECLPWNTTCATDTQGHGTSAAGIVGGLKSGVAKAVTMHAVKITNSKAFDQSKLLAAIDWVLTHALKPAVMSLSLGLHGTSPALTAAIDKAVEKGISVVAAAGNFGEDACGFSPASIPSAITVGASDRGDYKPDFSNYGKCLDIFAPGMTIRTASSLTDSSYGLRQGTSMAVPHVSGAAALLLQKKPSLSPKALAKLLVSTATPDVIKLAKEGSPTRLLFVGETEDTARQSRRRSKTRRRSKRRRRRSKTRRRSKRRRR